MEPIAPEYDYVVLGTGLTECVLSGVLSAQGKKVLHMDRNDHYGGEAASLNLEALYKKCGMTPNKDLPGRPSDWNIDLVPKFIMFNGELTNILNKTNVTKYLEFKQISGGYVQQGKGPKATIAKVPSTATEAASTPLIGTMEKLWGAKSFFTWVGTEYKADDPSTHKDFDIKNGTMKSVYKKFGLSAGSQDFIGHAMALYTTDDYVNQPGMIPETLERIQLYAHSMARYGKSPYIYPLYGIGELPSGFSRLSARFGGTYMLKAHIDEFLYEGDKVVGIRATHKLEDAGQTFETRAKKILADPSYFPGKVRVTGHLLRAIYILKEPLPNTDNADSLQLIIPQSQVGRKHDIYIAVVNSAHNVCPYYTDPVTKRQKPMYIAIISTTAESDANPQEELKWGKERLGPAQNIVEEFNFPPIPMYEPIESGEKDNVFISKSYDATSHFETTTDDIRAIYQRAEGKPFNVDGLVQEEDYSEHFTS